MLDVYIGFMVALAIGAIALLIVIWQRKRTIVQDKETGQAGEVYYIRQVEKAADPEAKLDSSLDGNKLVADMKAKAAKPERKQFHKGPSIVKAKAKHFNLVDTIKTLSAKYPYANIAIESMGQATLLRTFPVTITQVKWNNTRGQKFITRFYDSTHLVTKVSAMIERSETETDKPNFYVMHSGMSCGVVEKDND